MKKQGFKINIENINKNAIITLNEALKDEFPIVDREVFISHSHKNYKAAKKLKKTLEDNDLTVFFDPEEWRSMDDIVAKDHYQESEVKQHLIDQLRKQIKKSTFFVFINSNNSIDDGIGETSSEYIYQELATVRKYLLKEGYDVSESLNLLTEVDDVQDLINHIYEAKNQ